MTNIERARDLIFRGYMESERPAAMISFGKDSMVLAHIIRETIKRDKWSAHGFPVQVIYHRDPWFPWKHEFADKIIRSWSMEVHDFPPFQTGVKTNQELIELVARYNFGSAALDVPKNTLAPEAYPRRDFICGLNDWMLRPKTFLLDYPWDAVFLGHRSADVDPFEGAVPLNTDDTVFGDVRMMFPLKDWSDKEVWDYIEEHKIPTQPTRYRASDDRWYTNDYTHACTACIDPRQSALHVWCPKAKAYVKNRGGEVLQLHARPPYVGKEA